MSKKIKILTPRIYEHSDFFHNAYDFARENSLNTNELCLELSHYLVEHFDKVWKIEKPRIYKQITDLQSQLAEKNKEQNQKAIEELEKFRERLGDETSPIIFSDSYWYGKQIVLDILNNQIKELHKGGNGRT